MLCIANPSFKVALYMPNTNTPSHLYPNLINLNSAHIYTHYDTVSQMEEAITKTISSGSDDRININRLNY